MANEVDICRVCRCEGTPEQPLFHPCKCSGSIKYVHEECLVEWLKHANKQVCELCHTPFSFEPIYENSMPARLPWTVLVKGVIKRSWVAMQRLLRHVLVMVTWTLIQPWFTSQVWRLLMDDDMFQWRWHTMDLVRGALWSGVMVVVVLGVVLMRDFVVTQMMVERQRQRDMRQARGAERGMDEINANEGGYEYDSKDERGDDLGSEQDQSEEEKSCTNENVGHANETENVGNANENVGNTNEIVGNANENVERVERMEHVDRINPVDRMERINPVERIERIDRINPVELVENNASQMNDSVQPFNQLNHSESVSSSVSSLSPPLPIAPPRPLSMLARRPAPPLAMERLQQQQQQQSFTLDRQRPFWNEQYHQAPSMTGESHLSFVTAPGPSQTNNGPVTPIGGISRPLKSSVTNNTMPTSSSQLHPTVIRQRSPTGQSVHTFRTAMTAASPFVIGRAHSHTNHHPPTDHHSFSSNPSPTRNEQDEWALSSSDEDRLVLAENMGLQRQVRRRMETERDEYDGDEEGEETGQAANQVNQDLIHRVEEIRQTIQLNENIRMNQNRDNNRNEPPVEPMNLNLNNPHINPNLNPNLNPHLNPHLNPNLNPNNPMNLNNVNPNNPINMNNVNPNNPINLNNFNPNNFPINMNNLNLNPNMNPNANGNLAAPEPVEMTLQELLGLRGPFIQLFYHVLLMVAANGAVMIVLCYLPWWLGYCVEQVYEMIPLKQMTNKFGIMMYDSFPKEISLLLDENIQNLSFDPILSYASHALESIYRFLLQRISLLDPWTRRILLGHVTSIALELIIIKVILERRQARQSHYTFLIQVQRVYKLIFLCFLELILFPIYCGMTIMSMMAVIYRFPFILPSFHWSSHLFVTWLTGTLFMFLLSQLVQWTRDTVRPGLLFFIRHAHDPTYQPMREMLFQPLVKQLKRLFWSVLLYLAMMVLWIGVPAFFVRKLLDANDDKPKPNTMILFQMPSFMNAIAAVVIHLIWPMVLERALKNPWLAKYWSWTLKHSSFLLNMKWYILGERDLIPISVPVHYVFVPHQDRVYSPQERRRIMKRSVTIADCQRLNIPIDENATTMKQGPPLSKRLLNASSSSKYTIVKRPRFLVLRLVLFFFLVWFRLLLGVGVALFLPYFLGYSAIQLFFTGQVSLSQCISSLTGPHFLWTYPLGAFILMQMVHFVSWTSFVRLLHQTVLYFWLGTVISFELGMIWLWSCLPMIGVFYHAAFIPVVYPIQILTVGWVLSRTFFQLVVVTLKETSLLHIFMRQHATNDARSSRYWVSSVLAPFALLLAIVLVIPPLLLTTIFALFPIPLPIQLFLYKSIYLILLATTLTLRALWLLLKAYQNLLEKVRDDAFLVGRRLLNMD